MMQAPLKTMTITEPFGARGPIWTFGRHMGVDLRASVGTPIYAPESGTINEAYVGSNGILVLGLASSYWHRFLHLNQFAVGVGQRVNKGQLIGYTGNTGGVPAHLHWDTRKPGTAWNASFNNYVNPMTLITPQGGNVAVKTNLSTARILGETILGRDRDATHSAKFDADYKKFHTNIPLTNEYIMGLWQSGESQARVRHLNTLQSFYNTYNSKIAELSSRPTKAQLEELGKALKAEQAKVVEAEKALEEAKKTGGGISAEDSAAIRETNSAVKAIKQFLERIFK